MDRGLSVHRMPRLANSVQTPRLKERSRSPSPMGQSAPLATRSDSESAGHSADEIPVPMPPVFRKVTLQPGGGQKSDNRLGERRPSEHRLPRQLARTGETPRPMRVEQSPPPMVSSAPDAPITRSDADPPEEWKTIWRKEVRAIKNSNWCKKALEMVGSDRRPDLAFLTTKDLMRAAYRDKLTATEAASIFLYTSALYKDTNGSLLKGNLSKLRHNRREALETMIRNIDSGLSKLPLATGRLVRVVNLDDKFGSTLQVGAKWHGKGFGSTVRVSDQNMKWEGNYELYLETASGAHDVSAYSDAPKEREVLIERGHEYEVVSRDENGERVKLELTEIAPTGKQI
jgi:ADP-ribosyltransferase exoenzyme